MNEFHENSPKDKDFELTFPDRGEKETPEEYYTRFLSENLSEAIKNSDTFCNHKLKQNLDKISKEAGGLMGKNEKLARIDHLTGLKNRRGFEDEAKRIMREIERLKRDEKPIPQLSVVFMDVDNFKTINDECDHATGDLFLIDLSKLMTNTTRDKDVLARVGGDEFCLLLYGSSYEQANDIVERTKSYLKPFLDSYQNLSKPIDFSFGIAQWDQKQIDQKQIKKEVN